MFVINSSVLYVFVPRIVINFVMKTNKMHIFLN